MRGCNRWEWEVCKDLFLVALATLVVVGGGILLAYLFAKWVVEVLFWWWR